MSVSPVRPAAGRAPARVLTALLAAIALLLGGAVALAAPAAQAATTGSISGTVTLDGSTPAEDVEVMLVSYFEDEGFWDYVDDDITAADGTYSFSGIPAGEYRLVFSLEGYATVWWDGEDTLESADTITLTAGQSVEYIDVSLVPEATVAGTLTKNGGAAADYYVSVMRLTSPTTTTESGFTITDGTGGYSVAGLSAGTYTLLIESDDESTPTQYLGGTLDLAQATTFTLTAGQHRTGVDGVVTTTPTGGATISGTVTRGDTDEAVEDAEVTLYSAFSDEGELFWEPVDFALTAADGTYELANLIPGDYRVGFIAEDLAPEFWEDSSSLNAATTIEAGPDETVTGVDASLEVGGTVSGTITTSSGPAADFHVHLTRIADGVAEDVTSVYTDEDGTYTAAGLPAGTYTIGVHGDDILPPWQYLGGVADLEDATTFEVVDEQVTSGVDMTLVDGVTVSGTVRVPGGAAAGGVFVELVRQYGSGPSVSWETYDGEPTLINGSYSFEGLLPGTYTLFFDESDPYPAQFLGGTSTIDGATTFTVTNTNRTINHTLVPESSLDAVASATSLTLSRSSRAYGTSSTATVQVQSSAGAGTGTVAIKDGSRTVTTAALSGGKATLTLTGTSLSVGTHKLVAVYAGSGGLQASSSVARTLTVTKASSTTKATLVKKKIKSSAKGKVTVTVKAAGLVPGGKVKVKQGKKSLRSATLKRGKVTITLPKLKKGKHKLSVSYAGSSTVRSSATSVTLKVKR